MVLPTLPRNHENSCPVLPEFSSCVPRDRYDESEVVDAIAGTYTSTLAPTYDRKRTTYRRFIVINLYFYQRIPYWRHTKEKNESRRYRVDS